MFLAGAVERVARAQPEHKLTVEVAGLVVKASKTVSATDTRYTSVELLGTIEIFGGRFGLSIPKMVRFLSRTRAVLARGFTSGCEFESIAGSCIWCTLPKLVVRYCPCSPPCSSS
jgi:hypothetical protein